MKTIKPIFKENSKLSMSKWIIGHLPENHREKTYIEPFSGCATVLLNKEKSDVEVLNNQDSNVVKIYQALRDEPKETTRRINLYKCCEETFTRALKKEKFEDYLDSAINEFILRKMSKSEKKQAFHQNPLWESNTENLIKISNRIKEVYILNKCPFKIIETFNEKSTIVYCSPPYLYETNTSKKVYQSEMDTEKHIELSHLLNSFKGNVIISGISSPLYKRLYKNWKAYKNKFSGGTVETIWKNF
jgi:DNA adenine methylase